MKTTIYLNGRKVEHLEEEHIALAFQERFSTIWKDLEDAGHEEHEAYRMARQVLIDEVEEALAIIKKTKIHKLARLYCKKRGNNK